MTLSYTMIFALAFASPASAQAHSVGAPHPRATLGNTLTLIATPSSVTFQLASKGVAAASGSISVTTIWAGISIPTSISIYAYFTSSSSALSGGTPVAYIPSSAVFGQVSTGVPTSYTAFTQTGPFGGAGASLQIVSAPSPGLIGTRTDTLSLKIDLTSVPQLPAATYTGTLYLQAQEF